MTTFSAPVKTVALPTVYDRAKDSGEFLKELARMIHSSGMFGCDTPSQGYVLALECAARKMPPLALAERYHLIKGKLSMKADAMLADFASQTGGSHEILERSPERAAIKLTKSRKSHVFELTWADAAKEPFVYEGRESDLVGLLATGKTDRLKVKPKYATPRSRMQMLWARVVSDGVRAVAPEVVAGHYTPEETADYIEADIVPAEEAKTTEATPPAAKPARPDDGTVASEAEAQAMGKTTRLMTDEELPKHVPPPEPASPPANGKATVNQVTKVKHLVTTLGVNREKLSAMLARAGAAKVSDLSEAYCNGLIEVLEREQAKREGN